METITGYLVSFWNKIYTPSQNINIFSISHDNYTTPSRINYTTQAKTKMVPISNYYYVSTGYGRGYYTSSTSFIFKTEYESKSEYVPPSTSYWVTIKYRNDGEFTIEPKSLTLFCMSSTRQKSLIEYFENNKEINIRYFLGLPIIQDATYNFWFECPQTLLPIMVIPTLVGAYTISKFI